MSKILISENELRRVLFKTFLKNPKILKEQDGDDYDQQVKDKASKIIQRTLQRGKNLGQDVGERRALILATVRYDYAKSRTFLGSWNFLKLDPGHSLVDHAFLQKLPTDTAREWSKAAEVEGIQGQDVLEAVNIASSLAPADVIGKVGGRALMWADAVTTLISLINNVDFALYLKNRDSEEGLKGSGGVLNISTDPNTEASQIALKEGELGNEWAWYMGYAVCDAISLIPVVGYLIESKVLRGWLTEKEILTWNENKNKNLIAVTLDDEGKYVEKVNATAEAKASAGFEAKGTGTASVADHSMGEARKMIDEVNMDIAESFANVNKVNPGDEFDKIIDQLDAIITEDNLVKQTKNIKFDELKQTIRGADDFNKLDNEVKGLYRTYDPKKDTTVVFGAGQERETWVLDTDKVQAKKTSQEALNSSTQKTVTNNIPDSNNELNIISSERTLSKNKETLKKRIKKIKSKSKGQKASITLDEFSKLQDEVKKKYIPIKNNAGQITSYKLTDSTLNTTGSFDRIVDIEIKQSLELPLNSNQVTENDIDRFLDNLTATTGLNKETVYAEFNNVLSQVLKDPNKKITNTQEFLAFYREMLESKNSVFGKTFSKKLNDFRELARGKAKPRNISDIAEIFPDKLKELYTNKLNELEIAIKKIIVDDAIYTQITENLKNNPFILIGRSNKEIENYLLYFLNTKQPPLDAPNIASLAEFFKARQNNIKEIFELERDVIFYLNKSQQALDPSKLQNSMSKNYIADGAFNSNIQEFSEPFKLLQENNLINEFLYRKQVARFHKAINKNTNSKLEIILNLVDPTNQNSFLKKNSTLQEKYKNLKIGEVIDGVLKLDSSETIENTYQWFTYLNRLLGRYEAAFTIINEPDKVTKAEYIFDLIDKKVFEYADSTVPEIETLLNFNKLGNIDAVNDAIRNKTINPTYLQQHTTFSFLKPDEINVKIPELISHKQLENAQSAASTFNINTSGKLRNLIEEIKDLDVKLEQIVDINIEVIAELDKKINAVAAQVTRGADEGAEILSLRLQKQFLEDFNAGVADTINHIRTESSLGTDGLNILTQHKATKELGGAAETSADAIQTGKKAELASSPIEILQLMGPSGRESMVRVGMFSVFFDWFKNFFTDFQNRAFKKFYTTLAKTTQPNKKLSEVIGPFFTQLLTYWTKVFGGGQTADESMSVMKFIRKVLLPDSVKNIFIDLGALTGAASALKTYTMYSIIHQGFCFAALAGSIGVFVQGYLLGVGLKLLYRFLLSGDLKLAKLGRGMLLGLSKKTADISRVLMKVSKAQEKNFLRETASVMATDEPDAYMKALQQKVNFEHESQKGLTSSRSISAWGIDGLTGNWTENILGFDLNPIKQNFDSNDSTSIYGLLDSMFELYKKLPDDLDGWKASMTIKSDNKDFGDSIVGQVIDSFIGSITTANQSNTGNIDKAAQEYVKVTKFDRKKNEFLKAIIYIYCMDNVNNGSSVTAEVFKSEPFYFQETISQNLQNLFKLRNFLSEKIEVLASAVKMIGSKDFNIDSLITGGYHNVTVNGAAIGFRYAPRYGYSYVNDALKNKLIPKPHFQRTTRMPNGSEMRNISLELYSYHKLNTTTGTILNPMNILHSTLKPIHETIDLINMWHIAADNVLNGLPPQSPEFK